MQQKCPSIGYAPAARRSGYRWLPFIIGGVIVAACRKQPSDGRTGTLGAAADTFTVAFYNVENLFDNEFDGHEYVEYRPNATNWNREMHRRKFEQIGAVCAALDAEILALCEVEDRDALAQLRKVLADADCRYSHHAIIDTPAAFSTTRPALLSRYPIQRIRSLRVVLPAGGRTREILEADLLIGDVPLKFFINHWPSKHHPESWRLATAERLAERLRELPDGTDYIVLGDFNSDYDEFSTFATFDHDDTRGITGINHRLGTVRDVRGGLQRFATEIEAATGSFPSHYNLWLELPPAGRMSYVYKGNNQTPDNILLPPSMYDTSGIAYIDNSFGVFTWGGKLLAYGKPFRWKYRYRGGKKYHAGEGYSDHLPIRARFSTSPFRDARIVDTGEEASGSDTIAKRGWFEYHRNGWVGNGSRVATSRDTVNPVSGRYALHIVAPAQKRNSTAARAVLPPRAATSSGRCAFFIRGKGNVCFRTRRVGTKKWRYHLIVQGKESGVARYEPVDFPEWRPVKLSLPGAGDRAVEVELRAGKQVALDFWIDR